ncbi:histidine kinase [Novimethylophilus kurashikiensis]|uniref:Histidine kinase n=1 Tax=Novimethylophilus kurashikiensis TaxID=1825523 RepID=A0A2R5F8L2_9PROT|nr:hypothetical protein [Novimethylophilus kurashikiensis]GBG14537.1 histidine kinase [Novimethylophilus kurashikiensis]
MLLPPYRVSITGADDQTDPAQLVALSNVYPNAEWALLYFPEKEGQARNPSTSWRRRFSHLRKAHPLNTALHICGTRVYRDIIEGVYDEVFEAELALYDRVQVNINARHRVFSDSEIAEVYLYLLQHAGHLILQFHENSRTAIESFLENNPELVRAGRVSVLMDASRGRGVAPAAWPEPLWVADVPVDTGYAGGLGPDNVLECADQVSELCATEHAMYWVDMESNVRTNNVLDLGKVRLVLDTLHPVNY